LVLTLIASAVLRATANTCPGEHGVPLNGSLLVFAGRHYYMLAAAYLLSYGVVFFPISNPYPKPFLLSPSLSQICHDVTRCCSSHTHICGSAVHPVLLQLCAGSSAHADTLRSERGLCFSQSE
jgi:hypothetical protein